RVSPGCDHCYAEAQNRSWRPVAPGGRMQTPDAPAWPTGTTRGPGTPTLECEHGHRRRVFSKIRRQWRLETRQATLASLLRKPPVGTALCEHITGGGRENLSVRLYA